VRQLDDLTADEAARVMSPGCPSIEIMAICASDREFFDYMKRRYPNSPALWIDLPGNPKPPPRPKVMTQAELDDFWSDAQRTKTDRAFERYFRKPDFTEEKSTIRARLFSEAAEEWDFDNPGASHD
jgi:hypothetical protein